MPTRPLILLVALTTIACEQPAKSLADAGSASVTPPNASEKREPRTADPLDEYDADDPLRKVEGLRVIELAPPAPWSVQSLTNGQLVGPFADDEELTFLDLGRDDRIAISTTERSVLLDGEGRVIKKYDFEFGPHTQPAGPNKVIIHSKPAILELESGALSKLNSEDLHVEPDPGAAKRARWKRESRDSIRRGDEVRTLDIPGCELREIRQVHADLGRVLAVCSDGFAWVTPNGEGERIDLGEDFHGLLVGRINRVHSEAFDENPGETGFERSIVHDTDHGFLAVPGFIVSGPPSRFGIVRQRGRAGLVDIHEQRLHALPIPRCETRLLAKELAEKMFIVECVVEKPDPLRAELPPKLWRRQREIQSQYLVDVEARTIQSVDQGEVVWATSQAVFTASHSPEGNRKAPLNVFARAVR